MQSPCQEVLRERFGDVGLISGLNERVLADEFVDIQWISIPVDVVALREGLAVTGQFSGESCITGEHFPCHAGLGGSGPYMLDLLAEGLTIDTENLGGLGFVAVYVGKYISDMLCFHFSKGAIHARFS